MISLQVQPLPHEQLPSQANTNSLGPPIIFAQILLPVLKSIVSSGSGNQLDSGDFYSQTITMTLNMGPNVSLGICDESTTDGTLHFGDNVLDSLDKCWQMEPKMKEPYYECLNQKMDNQTNNSSDGQIEHKNNNQEMDTDIDKGLKMLDCLKQVMNVSINSTNDREILDLLCDKSLRKESFESEDGNETQKVVQYFQFDLTVDSIIQKCQKSNKIKVKDFYGSLAADKLRDVVVNNKTVN
ncbi:unnamed protein product [Medioppia subpectinata]|uniref:Uncharacterized protein n=1 Tax=Medioppia subpectinata TaxID=1979941 RepID=A0A7R9PYV6_9ACAR|nr:unnamed protein product [Medioppia subpectinata]CAG2105549.1 unnamed protein product [Medioppia subpectinata]